MKKLLWLIIACFPALALSANYFYCSQSNSYIYPGATITHVKKRCGKPIDEIEKKETPKRTINVERWTYQEKKRTVDTVGEPQHRAMLVIDFIDKKIAKMELDGNPIIEIAFCRTTLPLKIGMKQRIVYAQCRRPMKKDTIEQTQTEKPIIQKVLTYHPNPYQPPVKLIFEQDKLAEIQ